MICPIHANYSVKNIKMNSLHTASVSKNNNTQRTVQPVSVRCATVHETNMHDAYDCAVCCLLLFMDALTACKLFI